MGLVCIPFLNFTGLSAECPAAGPTGGFVLPMWLIAAYNLHLLSYLVHLNKPGNLKSTTWVSEFNESTNLQLGLMNLQLGPDDSTAWVWSTTWVWSTNSLKCKVYQVLKILHNESSQSISWYNESSYQVKRFCLFLFPSFNKAEDISSSLHPLKGM